MNFNNCLSLHVTCQVFRFFSMKPQAVCTGKGRTILLISEQYN